MFRSKLGKKIQSVLIYTTGDFPYGMAPENLVRQLALGLKFYEIKIKIIRLRGRSYNYKNDTGIDCSNLLFNKRVTNDILKLVEFGSILISIPFSVIKNKIKYNPDVIILYGIEYFYLIFPFWLFCRILNVKITRLVTDFYHETTIVPVWWKRPKLFFYHLQINHFDKYLDGIVFLTHFMAGRALKKGALKSQICVIPHFIDIQNFHNENIVTKTRSNIRIAFCGTVNKSNGIYDLIEAFKLVHEKYIDSKLVIIGEPIKSAREKIELLFTSFSNSFSITGLLSQKLVSKELLSCNILVNPRQSGIFAEAGFPTKLGEYFSTKLPVVSTNVGDIKYYFTNKKELVIVEPNEPESIAEGILFLINNGKIAEQIGINGYLWALSNLDYKENAQKLITFLNKI